MGVSHVSCLNGGPIAADPFGILIEALGSWRHVSDEPPLQEFCAY